MSRAVVKDCTNPLSYGQICVECNDCGRFDQKDEAEESPEQAVKCARCGRVLTDPRSIARGMGPVCAGKDVGQ